MINPDKVDMSPAAITRRLKEAAALTQLCLWLGKARDLGPVERSRASGSSAGAKRRKVERAPGLLAATTQQAEAPPNVGRTGKVNMTGTRRG